MLVSVFQAEDSLTKPILPNIVRKLDQYNFSLFRYETETFYHKIFHELGWKVGLPNYLEHSKTPRLTSKYRFIFSHSYIDQ